MKFECVCALTMLYNGNTPHQDNEVVVGDLCERGALTSLHVSPSKTQNACSTFTVEMVVLDVVGEGVIHHNFY